MMRSFVVALGLVVPCCAAAQMAPGMEMKTTAGTPSTSLMLMGLSGKMKTLSPADLKALPHVTVHVHNAHNGNDEAYSGVAVKDLLAMVEPAKGEGPKVSSNMIVVVAGATDNFHVALTLCDTNPDCHNGQTIVADTLDGAPIKDDGAFKLVVTEDKKPARWARNLSSLTVKAVN